MKVFSACLLGFYFSVSCGLANAESFWCKLPDEKLIQIDLSLPTLNVKHQVQDGQEFSVKGQLKQANTLVYSLAAKSYELNLKSLAYNRLQQGKPSLNGTCKAVASTQPNKPNTPAKPNQLPPQVHSPAIPNPSKPAPTPKSSNSAYTCGAKRYCKQMTSCEEAKYYLNQCGLDKLDKDGDGSPCENVCG